MRSLLTEAAVSSSTVAVILGFLLVGGGIAGLFLLADPYYWEDRGDNLEIPPIFSGCWVYFSEGKLQPAGPGQQGECH